MRNPGLAQVFAVGQAQVVRLMRNHQMGHPVPHVLLESAKSWILCFFLPPNDLVTIRNRKTTARARPAIIRLGVVIKLSKSNPSPLSPLSVPPSSTRLSTRTVLTPFFSNSSSTGVTATYQSELLAKTGKLSLDIRKDAEQKCCLQG